MTNPMRQTRLDYFLEAYQPMDPHLLQLISRRINRAGCSPEDPISMQIAHDTIMEERLNQHSASVQKSQKLLKNAIYSGLEMAEVHFRKNRAEDHAELSEQFARVTRRTLKNEIHDWQRSIYFHSVMQLLAAAALIVMVSVAAGYVVGRADILGLQAEQGQRASLADTRTWQKLQDINGNIDKLISKKCTLGSRFRIKTETGRRACALPLWLEGQTTPAELTAIQKTKQHAISFIASLPNGIVALIGIIMGITGSILWSIFKKPNDRENRRDYY